MSSGRRQEQERFAEDVELELVSCVVADDVVSAWIAGQTEVALAGDRRAARAVDGLQSRAVLEQSLADEPDSGVEEGIGAGGGDSLPGVALVANPDVAVVVVSTFSSLARAATSSRRRPSLRSGRSNRRGSRRRGERPVARTMSVKLGNPFLPGRLGLRPGDVGVWRGSFELSLVDRQDEVAIASLPRARSRGRAPCLRARRRAASPLRLRRGEARSRRSGRSRRLARRDGGF